jgi:hypothetical protein
LLQRASLSKKRSEHWSGALVAAAAFAFAATVTTRASAQSESQPTFDAGHGPISGSTRFIGLGGAFVAIAEDTEGIAINPASDAVRLPYSWQSWDFGLGIDVAIGAWLPKNDIYNQAEASDTGKSSVFFGSLAAIIYYDQAGFGLAAEAQRNAATEPEQTQGITPTSLSANFGIMHASLAYGFFDGQLLLGAGPRFIGTSLGRSGSGLFNAAGVGYEAGFIVKPLASQYRLAGAVKSPINAAPPGASARTVHVPWELEIGAAYQFSARPLNPKFVTAREVARKASHTSAPSKAELEAAEKQLFENYQRQERFYLLVSAELAVTQGGSQLDSEDILQGAGRRGPVLSPRLGLESEVVPHILKLRAGSYYEPPRVDEAKGRFHGTGGFDVRLFEWSVFGLMEPFDYWQLSVAADAARAYLNTSFSIGFWH